MRIIVIGGGIIGLTCSWKLALRGAEVTLFDSRKIGEGASGAALGALWPPSAARRGPLQSLHCQGLWNFEEFISALQNASGVDIPYARCGRIELLTSENAAAKAKEEIGLANEEWPALVTGSPAQEFLSADALRHILPACGDGFYGALLCHNTAQVHVPSLLAALRAACERAGATLHEETAAQIRAPGMVSTRLGLHDAEAVLITAGAWAGALVPGIAITPAKGQSLALARPTSVDLRRIVKRGSSYLVPWENEILVGATTEREAAFDETATDAAREQLQAAAAAIIPQLATTRVLRHWTGLRPDAPGHRPMMGPLPGMARTYVCAGHYKTGIGLAPVVGELMADLILDGVVRKELHPFLP